MHKSFEEACAEWQIFVQTDDISITFQEGTQYWLDADRILERRDQALGSVQIHEYRQTKSVNRLVWERETKNLYFEARADVFTLIENQWKIEERAE